MLALRSAAQLLAAASDVASLAAIASAAASPTPALPLDAEARTALGVRDAVCDARIIPGAGTLRALLVECPARLPLRESVSTLAARLAARSPHLLWLVIAARRDSTELAIVAWSAERAAPRVSALVVDRAHVLASDALTLASLAATSDAADVLTHASWLEVLGREALTRRFYRTLEGVVAEVAEEARGDAPIEDRHELALLHVSRLLFLSFLETKGLARRRPALSRERLRAMHGARRELSQARAAAAVLRHAQHSRWRHARRLRARSARFPFLNGGLFARTARATVAEARNSPTRRSAAPSASCSRAIDSRRAKTAARGRRPRSIRRCSAKRSSRSCRRASGDRAARSTRHSRS